MNIVKFFEVCDLAISRQNGLQKLSSKEAYKEIQQVAAGMEKEILLAVAAFRKHLAYRLNAEPWTSWVS